MKDQVIAISERHVSVVCVKDTKPENVEVTTICQTSYQLPQF